MFSIFKSSKKHTYKKKGSSFYHRENILFTIEDLNKILKHINSNSFIKSDTKIQIQGKFLESISLKNVRRLFGEEAFVLENDNDFINDHSIYFYRFSTQQYKFLIQFHFCENDFFLASSKVYSDHILSEKEKKDIVKRLIIKYCPEFDCKKFDFDIIDNTGNVLYTYDDLYFYVNYIPNNNIINELRKKYSGWVKQNPTNTLNDDLDKLL